VNRSTAIIAIALIGSAAYGIWHQTSRKYDLGWDPQKTQYELYNTWFLSPVGDRTTLSGDTPGAITFSADGKYALVNTCGYNDHTLSVIDWQTGKVVDFQKVSRSSFGLAVSGTTVFSKRRSVGRKCLEPRYSNLEFSRRKTHGTRQDHLRLDSRPRQVCHRPTPEHERSLCSKRSV
jgi:hypothetical protein